MSSDCIAIIIIISIFLSDCQTDVFSLHHIFVLKHAGLLD